MNITKQIHRYRELMVYQWRKGKGEGQDRGEHKEVQTTMYKINKQKINK